MHERMEVLRFDDKKAIENLKEAGNFHLDESLQRELRDLTVGSPEVLRENSRKILSRLEYLLSENPEAERELDEYREIFSILRPCHSTSGEALLDILQTGRFMSHHELSKKTGDFNHNTQEADQGANLDLSVFSNFEFSSSYKKGYSVVFKQEILDRPTTFFSFHDIASMLESKYGDIFSKASKQEGKNFLDQYVKQVIPGSDCLEIISKVAPIYIWDNPKQIHFYDHILTQLGLPRLAADKKSGPPEVHLFNPTIDDIEAVVFNDKYYTGESEETQKKVRRALKEFNIPFKNITDDESESPEMLFFKELEERNK